MLLVTQFYRELKVSFSRIDKANNFSLSLSLPLIALAPKCFIMFRAYTSLSFLPRPPSQRCESSSGIACVKRKSGILFARHALNDAKGDLGTVKRARAHDREKEERHALARGNYPRPSASLNRKDGPLRRRRLAR